MPRQTPYRRYRYPLSPETVDAVAVQNLAGDIDADMTVINTSRSSAFKRSAAHTSANTVSLVKNTLTVITLTAPTYDNGALGAGAAPYWAAGNPTRLTAPATGLYLVEASAFVQFSGAGNITNYTKIQVTKNGSLVAPNLQEAKFALPSSYPQAAVVQMWSLAAGDYLEVRIIWNGLPAGPLSLTSLDVAISQIALP